MQLAYSISLRAPRAYRLALSVFFFIQGLVFASWASRIPDIKEQMRLSDGALGGLLLALPAGQMAGMALSGYLVSRFGSRLIMLIAAFLYPGGLILLGAANSVTLLAGALVLFGLCGNLMNIAANTQAVGVEALYRRSILASFHGLWSLAGFTGGLLGALMVARHQTPLVHYAIVFALTMLLVATSAAYLLPRDAPKKSGGHSIFVKPDRNIIVLGLITFACMICEGTMFDWSGVYFDQVVHAPVEWSRLGFIAFMSAMAGGRFAADYFITRFGAKPMLKSSGIIILTGLLLSVLLPSIVTATIGFLLVGLGVASVVPLSYSIAGRSKTIPPGVALAMVSSIGFLGFLLGPPLIGFVAEGYGLRWSFTLIAVLGLGTTLLAGSIKKYE
ncbi:MFS transporter [Chitinophaga cymbidii]|uniref:MFS transporter n=1 Tax=Chitinophaga cymbidii TaxID=1096750 RepID=A0A512RNW1_9BACT|nr:MFS transporter [Chitinophaga cymbidii]GEP97388.1 MFS transporter [Chitinophaga cymbidii]